jgi:hypothetical protein
MYGLSINKSSLGTSFDFAIRSLQKPAVAIHNLVSGVASEPLEGVGDINNGVVLSCDIAEHKGTGEIDSTDVDLRVRAYRNSTLLMMLDFQIPLHCNI